VVFNVPEPRVVRAGEHENKLTVMLTSWASLTPLNPGDNAARPDWVVGGGPEHFCGRTAAPTGLVVVIASATTTISTNPRVARIVPPPRIPRR
jgi:hypothetical protein